MRINFLDDSQSVGSAKSGHSDVEEDKMIGCGDEFQNCFDSIGNEVNKMAILLQLPFQDQTEVPIIISYKYIQLSFPYEGSLNREV